MPRFRPPRLPKELRALEGPLSALYEDLQALERAPGDVAIQSKTYRASPGETVRVSPPPEGMGLVLPPPSADNRASEITVLIERPAGDLRVFVSQDGPAGPSGAPTIDGEEMRVYSTEGALRFKSNGATRWCDARGATGATGAAGATGATGATGPAGVDGAARQIRREVYYADGTREVYDEDNELSSSGASPTWTQQSDGNLYEVWIVPSGSSGGSGARGTGNQGGGHGAGGGFVFHRWFSRAEMALLSGSTVTVGAGVSGGAGLAAGTAGSAGNPGTIGNASSLGPLIAYPGGLGAAGQTGGPLPGGSGGGSLGPGLIGAGAATRGGLPATDANKYGVGGAGAGANNTPLDASNGSAGLASEHGGAAGGGPGTGRIGGPGGNSLYGCPGAGAGGSNSTVNRIGGGAGGGIGVGSLYGGGVAGSGTVAGEGSGTDGTDGTDGDVLTCTVGLPGSGGQSALTTASGVFTSGRGGNGGFPGGSGAGSGGACRPSGSANIATADGGDGADGVVAVVTCG